MNSPMIVQLCAKFDSYNLYIYGTVFGQITLSADFRKAGKRVGVKSQTLSL
jgi:hypothetical protein